MQASVWSCLFLIAGGFDGIALIYHIRLGECLVYHAFDTG